MPSRQPGCALTPGAATEGVTALRACILAGGFTPYAAPNRATITRREGEKDGVIRIELNVVVFHVF